MATITLGMATSHSPMMNTPAELWGSYVEIDKRSKGLISPRSNLLVSYEELLDEARSDPRIAQEFSQEKFDANYALCQEAIAQLVRTYTEVSPDVVVMFTDDQGELFFYDNMPMINVYWGNTFRLVPRTPAPDAPPGTKASTWGFGTTEMEVPVETGLAYHLIEFLRDADFDISHTQYLHDTHGGTIGPAGYYLDTAVKVAPRYQGMGHGFAFLVKRIMEDKPVPVVPIALNTCYPPNAITPRRAYALGMAVRDGIRAWSTDRRVAVMGSGGLSHLVVDEIIDRLTLKGLMEADGELLSSLPRERLQANSSEILNWLACAGAMAPKKMTLLNYVPVYRSLAGSGGGWAQGVWV